MRTRNLTNRHIHITDINAHEKTIVKNLVSEHGRRLGGKPASLLSTSYMEDSSFISYCLYESPKDPACDCINLNTKSYNLDNHLVAPECSSTCMRTDVLKTFLTQEKQKRCTSTNCNILIQNLTLKGDVNLSVKNRCESATYEYVLDNVFIQEPLMSSFSPSFPLLGFPLLMIVSMFSFLVGL